MVAPPLTFALTSPFAATDATLELSLLHVTPVAGCDVPFDMFTVAVKVEKNPVRMASRPPTVTPVTVGAAGATGVGAVGDDPAPLQADTVIATRQTQASLIT